MYNLKNYEKKYKKYKNKYQILKSHIGGDCSPLPNPEEEDLATTHNLLDLCPEERITIQNKCYDVKGLYTWIIEGNHKKLPTTQTEITPEDKKRLIEAYDELSKVFVPNILTREKLIQLYPNPKRVKKLYLSNGYTDIALGTFNNLSNLQELWLYDNQLKKIQPGIFAQGTFGDNLRNLQSLSLSNNQIKKIEQGIFYNLLNLKDLYLSKNHIQELQPGIFNNLPRLVNIYLNNNRIQELQPGIFNNLPKLCNLHLDFNRIQELQVDIFNNLPNLRNLHLDFNQIQELQPGAFNNLPNLERLYLNNNPIIEFQSPEMPLANQYYGLSNHVRIIR